MNKDILIVIREVLLFDVTTPRGLQKLNALLLIMIATAYLHLFLVPIEFDKWTSEYFVYLLMAIFYFVPQVVEVVFFARDTLQYDKAGKNRYASFFQKQFPSKHIMQKFGLTESESLTYWFSIFNKWRSPNHSNNNWYRKALQRGYKCRLIYYLQRWTWRFAILSWITLAIVVTRYVLGVTSFIEALHQMGQIPNMAWKIAYPCILLALYLLLRKGHQTDAKHPTGVWREWKEMNDIMKTWLDQNALSVDQLKNMALADVKNG